MKRERVTAPRPFWVTLRTNGWPRTIGGSGLMIALTDEERSQVYMNGRGFVYPESYRKRLAKAKNKWRFTTLDEAIQVAQDRLREIGPRSCFSRIDAVVEEEIAPGKSRVLRYKRRFKKPGAITVVYDSREAES